MLLSTRGIVIRTTKYSETSLIARIFTEHSGMQSFLIRGIHRSTSRLKPSLFQPLALLDLVIYQKQKNSLQSIKEAGYFHPYQSILFDIRKISIALFIQELIQKTIREEEANPGMFDFLASTCIELDRGASPGGLFPVIFALRFTKYLGFAPGKNFSGDRKFFNLKEGLFQEKYSEEYTILDETLSALLNGLLEENPVVLETGAVPAKTRNLLLEKVLLYYQLHLPGFEEMKSHQVLHTVLS